MARVASLARWLPMRLPAVTRQLVISWAIRQAVTVAAAAVAAAVAAAAAAAAAVVAVASGDVVGLPAWQARQASRPALSAFPGLLWCVVCAVCRDTDSRCCLMPLRVVSCCPELFQWFLVPLLAAP